MLLWSNKHNRANINELGLNKKSGHFHSWGQRISEIPSSVWLRFIDSPPTDNNSTDVNRASTVYTSPRHAIRVVGSLSGRHRAHLHPRKQNWPFFPGPDCDASRLVSLAPRRSLCYCVQRLDDGSGRRRSVDTDAARPSPPPRPRGLLARRARRHFPGLTWSSDR